MSYDLEWTMKSGQVEQNLKKLQEAQDKFNESMKGATSEAKKAERELMRFAAGVNKAEAKPIEELERKYGMLRLALEKNLITQDKYNAAIAKSKAAYQSNDGMFQQAQKTIAAAKAVEEAKKAEAEAIAAANKKAVESLAAMNMTPLERYKQNVAELNRLKTEAGLSEETYTRALKSEKKELQDSIGLTDRRKKALKEVETATKEATAAEKKATEEAKRFGEATRTLVATPIEKYKARVDELRGALKAATIDETTFNRAVAQAQEELSGAGDAGNKAFGEIAISMLGQYGSAVGLATAGVGMLASAWNDANAAAAKALETSRQMDKPNSDILQLTDTTGEYQAGMAKRDELAIQYGIKRAEATDMMFAAQSAGLSDNQLVVAARSQHAGLDPSDTALFEGKVKEIYKGAISPEAAVNVAGQAAAKYPLNPNDFVKHMPTTMGSANNLGLSFEQASSIVGNFSTQTGTPAEAFERANNLFAKMGRLDEFKGQGMAGLDKLAGMTKEQQEQLFGKDQQTDEAIRYVKTQLPQIKEDVPLWQRASRETGTKNDWLANKAAAKMGDPGSRAKFKLDQSEAAAEIAREKRFGTREALKRASLENVQASIENSNVDSGSRWAGSTGANLAYYMGGSPETIGSVGTTLSAPGAYFAGGMPGLRKHLRSGVLGPDGAGTSAVLGGNQPDPRVDKTNEILGKIEGKLDKLQPTVVINQGPQMAPNATPMKK